MSEWLFKINHVPSSWTLGTKTNVVFEKYDDPACSVPLTRVLSIERDIPSFIEANTLNWMADLSEHQMVGVHRIQGYEFFPTGDIKPSELSTGIYGAVMLDDMAYYRKQGILLVGKAKSQTDVFYKWKNPHKDTIPLWNEFLSAGKLFKEFQRCLGGTIVKFDSPTTVIARVVDIDQYMVDVHDMRIKDACDGVILTKHSMSMNLRGKLEKQYSYGTRVLDHPVFRSVKGNLVSDLGTFKKVCIHFGIDPSTVDVLIPKSSVKVGNPSADELYDITDHIRFVSLKTEKVMANGKITTVGAGTLGKYAKVVCELLSRGSVVDKVTDLCSRVIEGDLAAYAKAVRAGMNSSVMAEVSAIALPIWRDGKWTIIRNNENIQQLYSRVTSLHLKNVRKARLKCAFNRRAYCTPSIEAANHNNYTGAYIVKLSNGYIDMPMSVWTSRTLGDFDGDDAIIVKVAKFVYLIFRNPVNGPSSMFIGLERNRATVQDVPEWCMPLVKYHKSVRSVPEPSKPKVDVPDTLKGCVDQYFETMINAWANSPLLGSATNNLYIKRMIQMSAFEDISAQEYADEAAKIEFQVVKAIKSTLSSDLSMSLFSELITFGSDIDEKHLYHIRCVASIIDKVNRDKLYDIFPQPRMTDHQAKMWSLCNKYSYGVSYEGFVIGLMERHFDLRGHCDYDNYVRSIPIFRAMRGYNPESFIRREDSDVLVADKICTLLCSKKPYYKLPTVSTTDVREINALYVIFTAKRMPGDDYVNRVASFLDNEQNTIRKYNIRGADLVTNKIRVAKVLLRRFTGLPDSAPLSCIIEGYNNHADIVMGVRDIADTQLRSFAYTCIHTWLKIYIEKKFSSEDARMTAMFETGKIVFGMKNGVARSSRLFWQYFSTFSKEYMAKISNLWCDVQSDVDEVDHVSPLSVAIYEDLIDHAHTLINDDSVEFTQADLDSGLFETESGDALFSGVFDDEDPYGIYDSSDLGDMFDDVPFNASSCVLL